MNRRSFLSQGLTAAVVVGTTSLSSAQTGSSSSSSGAATKPAEVKRRPPLVGDTVFEFVRAGHGDLPKVKKMLGEEPLLLNGMWDWGGGDWETALGGASHIGSREVALHLLDAGARIDAFCAAMLGEADFVKALLRFNPSAATARGPHGYTLLYHVGYTGDVDLAKAVSTHVADHRARHFNQSLQSAVARSHTDLVAWLLSNGVDDPNTQYFNHKTPLDVATDNQNDEIARLLRTAGGTRGGGTS
jgi:hypothetical protein